MLQYLGWDSLEERRLHSRATKLYRIVHALVAIPLHPNLQWNTRETRGHSTKFFVPTVRVDAYRFSFFPATVTLWNNLPSDVVLSPSVNCFRTRVSAIRLNTITHWVPQIHVFNLHVCLYCSSAGFTMLCTCSTPVLHHCQSFTALSLTYSQRNRTTV